MCFTVIQLEYWNFQKRGSIFGDWTDEINNIIEKCSHRAADLLLEDFIMARDSKSMKVALVFFILPNFNIQLVNKNLQELLDNFLPIEEFLEFGKIQANGGPKEVERAKLGWYK